MTYESVYRLFEVELDGEEVQLVWKRGDVGEVFLGLSTELALEWVDLPQEQRVEFLVVNYGDLVAEHLAAWVDDLYDCE